MPILKKMIAQEQAGWLARAQAQAPAGYAGSLGADVPGLGNRPSGINTGSLMNQPGGLKGEVQPQHVMPGGVRPLPRPGLGEKPGLGGGVLPGPAPVGSMPAPGPGGAPPEPPIENPGFVDPSQVSGEPVSGAARRFETTSDIVQRISPNVRSRYSAPGRLRGLGGGGVRRLIRRGVETLPSGARWQDQTNKFDRQRLLEAAIAGGQ